MRVVDDLVDERKAIDKRLPEIEKRKFTWKVNGWLATIKTPNPTHSFQKQLVQVRKKFKIPLWPWQRLSHAMVYDLDNDGFKTFSDFIRYSENAAIAPGSVFMHLCGVVKDNGHFGPPSFDVRQAARPIALFAYLVHIIMIFKRTRKTI